MTNTSTTNLEDEILELMQTIFDLQNRIDTLEHRPTLNKDVFNSEEAAAYLGVTKSQLYKLTYTHAIPFFKPSGRHVQFERRELLKWVTTNAVSVAS